MSSIDQLFAEAAQLPADQRLTLAHRLLVSGEPEITADVEEAWEVEIRDRIQRYDRGELATHSAGEVFAEDDRRLKT